MNDIRETAWDHISGESFASFCTSERKWVNTIEKLKEQYPDLVDIRAVNEDGSLLAHIPVEWLRLRPKKKRSMTEEQIAASTQRLRTAREKRLRDLKNVASEDMEGEEEECVVPQESATGQSSAG